MRPRQILTCLFLLALMPLSAKALPPPSPAGGNYLELDGVDDYAVLDFETFGILLPEGTDEYTVEAWIYPTTPPADDIHAMILSQQVRMDVVNDVHVWMGGHKGRYRLEEGGFIPKNPSACYAQRKGLWDILQPESTSAEPMASHRFPGEWASDNNNR